ncbi:unnamed protein product [Eretmochelys imbricata]
MLKLSGHWTLQSLLLLLGYLTTNIPLLKAVFFQQETALLVTMINCQANEKRGVEGERETRTKTLCLSGEESSLMLNRSFHRQWGWMGRDLVLEQVWGSFLMRYLFLCSFCSTSFPSVHYYCPVASKTNCLESQLCVSFEGARFARQFFICIKEIKPFISDSLLCLSVLLLNMYWEVLPPGLVKAAQRRYVGKKDQGED